MSNKREVWTLYLTAKTSRSRPSDLVGLSDRWAAYQFDAAVSLIGTTLENAGQEMVEAGSGKDKKMVPKYMMDELLSPDFRLPRPPTKLEREKAAIDSLFALARGGKSSGVKVFKARPEGDN